MTWELIMSTELKVIEPDNPEAVAESLMPYYPDDTNKTKYLSYRASGFTKREALALINCAERTLRDWCQHDPDFAAMDNQMLGEMRAKFGPQFAFAEFMRNFRLVMAKDFDVLKKAFQEPENLTVAETAYMMKIRQFYTPQQLEAMMGLAQGKDRSSQPTFNFTQVIQQMSRG